MAKIFVDFHHTGLARGVCRLFRDRLGHAVFFPTLGWCQDVTGNTLDKIWTFTSEVQGTWHGCEGLPPTIDRDRFLSSSWDIILVTRTESQPIFKQLLKEHVHGDKIKPLAISGNQGGGFDWSWVYGLLTSDLPTYHHAPLTPDRKIHYSQEITVRTPAFVPILPDNLNRVHCYMNFLLNYTTPYHPVYIISPSSECPHCKSDDILFDEPRSSTLHLWHECRERLPNHRLNSYGWACEHGHVEECFLPIKYTEGALSWHFKHVEGYGFSLLQSIACGRLPIVQERFYRYRTAGRYLINNLTCFEVPWNSESICDVIRWFTSDLDRANEYSEACWKAGQALLNWEHEANRVEAWLKGLGL